MCAVRVRALHGRPRCDGRNARGGCCAQPALLGAARGYLAVAAARDQSMCADMCDILGFSIYLLRTWQVLTHRLGTKGVVAHPVHFTIITLPLGRKLAILPPPPLRLLSKPPEARSGSIRAPRAAASSNPAT
jgi:hypothetical protein